MKKKDLKIGVVGGVKATEIVIDKLYENAFRNIFVWGYNPKDISKVSGWVDLKIISEKYSYSYEEFKNINKKFESIDNNKPDLLFIVGLSQIVNSKILKIPKYGCIGFHPTFLPDGRGRAPLAWLLLDAKTKGASTFFQISEGVDNGPIIKQISFDIYKDDYVSDIEKKMLEKESQALDSMLNDINFPKFKLKKQNEDKATYYGKRTAEDGIIEWREKNIEIIKLIRSASYPHPGSYTFQNQNKLFIFRAVISDKPIKGVIGRILQISEDNDFYVQAKEGLVKVTEWTCENENWKPKVGMRLGYNSEEEIFKLKNSLELISNKIIEIQKNIDS